MTASAPLVWVLTGERIGDNNQALDLAEAIGLPFEEKRLRYRAWHHLPRALYGRGFLTLTPEARAALRPPWPDLVIGIGKRSVPVARGIQACAGKPVGLVQIGEPRSPPGWFDLVLTTPQYGVPAAPNVIRLPHALTRGIGPHPADAVTPLHVVLVGGPSWPWRIDERALLAAAHVAYAAAERGGGRAVALTGRRTGAALRVAMRGVLGADAVDTLDYRAALGAGTCFYVTADSVSMLSDAIVTGRPIGMIDVRPTALGRLWIPSWRAARGARTLYPRDLQRFWTSIREAGLVGTPEHPRSGAGGDVRAVAGTAVLALLADPPSSA